MITSCCGQAGVPISGCQCGNYRFCGYCRQLVETRMSHGRCPQCTRAIVPLTDAQIMQLMGINTRVPKSRIPQGYLSSDIYVTAKYNGSSSIR